MLRAERRISRRELAEALGVHYQTIGYLERGEFSPSLHLALRIAAYFDVSVEVVFSLKPFKRLGEGGATCDLLRQPRAHLCARPQPVAVLAKAAGSIVPHGSDRAHRRAAAARRLRGSVERGSAGVLS